MACYLNDHEDETSIAVNEKSIPALSSIEEWEYIQTYHSDYLELNADLQVISFSEEPLFN